MAQGEGGKDNGINRAGRSSVGPCPCSCGQPWRWPGSPVKPRHRSPSGLRCIYLPRAHKTRADYTAGVVPPECMQHASCHATLLSRSEGLVAVFPESGSGAHSEARSRGHVLQKHGNRWVRGMRQKTAEAAEKPVTMAGQRLAAQQVPPNLFSTSVCIDLVGFRGRLCPSSRPNKHHTWSLGREVSPTKISPADAFQPGG